MPFSEQGARVSLRIRISSHNKLATTEPWGQCHPSQEHSNLSYPTGCCFAQGRSCKSSY